MITLKHPTFRTTEDKHKCGSAWTMQNGEQHYAECCDGVAPSFQPIARAVLNSLEYVKWKLMSVDARKRSGGAGRRRDAADLGLERELEAVSARAVPEGSRTSHRPCRSTPTTILPSPWPRRTGRTGSCSRESFWTGEGDSKVKAKDNTYVRALVGGCGRTISPRTSTL